jgi:radical SAM protein with 4Fe4S-binding SPASM domain
MAKKLDKEKLLTKSKHFCMLPWVHMHILPNSSVVPCCVWPYDQPVGNVKNNSLKEIWNNENYKDLRRKMLNDEVIPNCSQCYEREMAGETMRMGSLREWHHHFDDIVEPTVDDAELKQFNMALFDVRFSNICNFKCRGCSPDLSSAWFSDYEKLYDLNLNKEKLVSIMPNENAWQELLGFLPTVERVYFAGGEPLIMDEHYLVLEELLRLEKYDVTLSYNTNMSNLRFRDKFAMDYWKKFKNVSIGVSIDDFGVRGEYFRHGMNWQKTVENIRIVKENCPHVVFSVNCTVSLYNVYYLSELHAEVFNLGLIKLGDFLINLLINPVEYRVQVLPPDFRIKVAKKLRDYILKIEEVHYETDASGVRKLSLSFQSVLNFLLEGDEKSNREKFMILNNKLDHIRNEDFEATYPELAFLKNTEDF